MRDRAYKALLKKRGFVLVDGGLATELERRGHVLDTALWSAALLADDPAAIRAVHADYLEAGADIDITATYQASFRGFSAEGIGQRRGRELMQRAVDIAREARDAHEAIHGGRHALVAASIGPYGAALGGGAEYTGDYGIGEAGLVDFHRERLALLAASGADLLAVETIPSLAEVRAVAALLGETAGPDAWVSFSCRDSARLNDGSAVEDACAACANVPRIAAVGVNCTHPDHGETLVRRVRAAAPEHDIVVYPNLGEPWDAVRGRWGVGGSSAPFEELAVRWYDAGARLIGGCCRTTPALIAAVGRRLDRVVGEAREGAATR